MTKLDPLCKMDYEDQDRSFSSLVETQTLDEILSPIADKVIQKKLTALHLSCASFSNDYTFCINMSLPASRQVSTLLGLLKIREGVPFPDLVTPARKLDVAVKDMIEIAKRVIAECPSEVGF